MQKVYVRELKPYSLAALADLLQVTSARAREMVEQLMMRGVVGYRADRADDDEDGEPDELYQFRFVGLAMIGDIVIVAYPKYFRNRLPSDDEMRVILRAIKRNAGFASLMNLADVDEMTTDKLPVMLALLDLYGEYGEYVNHVSTRVVNGAGDIDWNRTINAHLPLISGGRPVYAEYETCKTLRDDSDFITRLHRAVLTECSRELSKAGVSDLLSLEEIWLSDEDVDDFGDAETLEWRLGRERSEQFVNWKQQVLDLLERYLLSKESGASRDEIRMLGTTSFYHLWESACKVAFCDVLDWRLGQLGLPLAGEWADKRKDTLLGIIPRPLWERYIGNGYVACGKVDTLIPDTVSLAVDGMGRRAFCIYDAKYYVPSLSGQMRHQPGLESVTKQFLYQSAYGEFVADHGFDRVVNAFLVPSGGDYLVKMARVSFEKVMGKVAAPFSNYVDMWALPANRVFEAYLDGERIDGSEMKAIWADGEA